MTYRLLDLFSGIGGFSLGLERSGAFKTVAFCEIEPFCRKVLEKHWPDVPCYDDIRTLTADRLAADGITVDAICGGFPCQDLSSAGKMVGIEGDRSGLWSEIVRLCCEIGPEIVVVENVANLLTGDGGRWFSVVLSDLAALGYDAEWHCIPASHVGALHQRDRVWIVAYPHSDRLRFQGIGRPAGTPWPQEQFARLVQMALRVAVPTRNGGGVAERVPDRSHRLKSIGNAVVPQIPELIGRAIAAADADRRATSEQGA